MKPTCTICGNRSAFLLEKDGYSIYECPKCHLSFVYPQPAATFLKEEVYSEKSGYQANKPQDLSKVIPTNKQQKVLAYLKSQPKGKFLDIGCSSGELMYFAKNLGLEVCGVELNGRTAGIAKANGLNVTVGTLEQAHFIDKSFDYIHLGDIIEHVNDPRILVKEAKRLLKSNGKLIVVTPNMECLWANSTLALHRMLKIPWGSATPPHHLFQFSFGNLKVLLDQEGFRFDKAWFTGTPSLKYELGSLHLVKKWKSKRTVGNLAYMLLAFGLYSAIFGINRIVELFPFKKFSMALVFHSRA